jgi:very-short-patch-repair endonuclease
VQDFGYLGAGGFGVSKGEAALELMLKAYQVSFEREYRFAPPRRWRADFALVEPRILVEVEGGVWSGGRHTTGAGFEKDAEKYNAATAQGWRVFRYSTGMVTSGEAITQIMGVLNGDYQHRA